MPDNNGARLGMVDANVDASRPVDSSWPEEVVLMGQQWELLKDSWYPLNETAEELKSKIIGTYSLRL